MDTAELHLLLTGLGIPAASADVYSGVLVEKGFDCEAALNTLTDHDLENMGVKLGHRRLLLQHLSNMPRPGGETLLHFAGRTASTAKRASLVMTRTRAASASPVGKRRNINGAAAETSTKTPVAAPTAPAAPAVSAASAAAADGAAPKSGNDKLAEIFAEMGAVQRLKRDFFRARAYEQAARAIHHHPVEILSGAQAREIDGIGAGMAKRIDIVLETGELEELKDLQRDDDVVAIRCLRMVHGIGVVRAMKLIERGIRSLADLRAAVADSRVHLNAAERLGMAHAEEFAQKIPRTEMIEHERLLLKVQNEQHPGAQGLVCGSYRRGARASGDIDFFMSTHDFHNAGKIVRAFIQSLKDIGYITGDIVNGFKYMGVCRLPGPGKLHRRLDVRCFPAHQAAFGTLYFTGSKWLSIRLRRRAIELGMTLNEYSLVNSKTGETVSATTEREIFEALGMTYLEPTER